MMPSLSIVLLLQEMHVRGFEELEALEALGIRHEAKRSLASAITLPHLHAMFEAALAATGDPTLGLHVGQRIHFDQLAIRRLSLPVQSLRGAVTELDRVDGDDLHEKFGWSLTEGGVYARMSFLRDGGPGDGARLLSEVTAQFAIQLCRVVAGAEPLRVLFEHECPGYRAQAERALGCAVWYGQRTNGLMIAKESLDLLPILKESAERRSMPVSAPD